MFTHVESSVICCSSFISLYAQQSWFFFSFFSHYKVFESCWIMHSQWASISIFLDSFSIFVSDFVCIAHYEEFLNKIIFLIIVEDIIFIKVNKIVWLVGNNLQLDFGLASWFFESISLFMFSFSLVDYSTCIFNKIVSLYIPTLEGTNKNTSTFVYVM